MRSYDTLITALTAENAALKVKVRELEELLASDNDLAYQSLTDRLNEKEARLDDLLTY